MEIERKFLISEVPDLEGKPSSRIEQGYLALADGKGGAEVRLRRRDADTLLTVKSEGTTTRVEEEIEIDSDRFESLWPLTEGRRLSKRRFVLDEGSATIELDVYEGELEGLVVGEVEFGDEAAADKFGPPAWFGEDVTADPSFRNARLATEGKP